LGTHTKRVRIPEEYAGIQVIHCKNIKCSNFGIPAASTSRRGMETRDSYALSGSGTINTALHCRISHSHSPNTIFTLTHLELSNWIPDVVKKNLVDIGTRK
jgi:hypothetical protein